MAFKPEVGHYVSTLTIIAEVETNSSSMIILAEKIMCTIAFCTGPNPPMNIDLSLTFQIERRTIISTVNE